MASARLRILKQRFGPEVGPLKAFDEWALKFATLPNGRVNKSIRDALLKLGAAERASVLSLLDNGHSFEFWQTGEGLWHCRVRLSYSATHCSRAHPVQAIEDCLAAPGSTE